jgi:hypothetical protein
MVIVASALIANADFLRNTQSEGTLPGEEDCSRREIYGGRQIELRRCKLAARNRFSLAT